MPSPSQDESQSPERQDRPPRDIFAPVGKYTALVVCPISMKGGGPCDSSKHRIECVGEDGVAYEAEG